LPLRHPLHTAKAAASVDRLSRARLVLGVASGDRPELLEEIGSEIIPQLEASQPARGQPVAA